MAPHRPLLAACAALAIVGVSIVSAEVTVIQSIERHAAAVASNQSFFGRTLEGCASNGAYCGNNAEGAKCCTSSTDYCQPWNPNYYQCRSIPAKCGKQEVGVDYYGNDLSTVYGLLPEECCDKCTSTTSCKAYTFVNYNADGRSACYLKSGAGEKRPGVGAVSAVIAVASSEASSAGTVCSASSGGGCGNDKDGVQCCPSGEYCQPWDPFYYQCRPAPALCSAQQAGVDFTGDDLETVVGILPADCCARCADTVGCKAYTFVNYNSNGKSACYLKSGVGAKRNVVGAVSAEVTNPKPACTTGPYGMCGNRGGSTCCSTGFYCQPWDSANYQCMPKPSQCSQQFTDIDFYGEYLSTVYGVSLSDCCAKCSQMASCKAYTFVNDNPNTPACYLKKGVGTKRESKGAVSGVVDSPATSDGTQLPFSPVDFDWMATSNWEYSGGAPVASSMFAGGGIKLTPANSAQPIRTKQGWGGEKIVLIEWERSSTSDTNIWMLNTKLQNQFGVNNGWPYWGEIDIFEMFTQDAIANPWYNYAGNGEFTDASKYGQLTLHMGQPVEKGSPCYCPSAPSRDLWYQNTRPMTTGCTAQFTNTAKNSIATIWGSDSNGKYIQLIQNPTITKGGRKSNKDTYDIVTGSGTATTKIYNNKDLFWGMPSSAACAAQGGHNADTGFPFFEDFRIILEEQKKNDASAWFKVTNVQIFKKN